MLTVLDFIGQQRREFRFDAKMMALAGASRREVANRLGRGPSLAAWSSAMQLDRVAREIVLISVRDQLDSRLPRLVADARSIGTTDLATFLAESGHDLPTITGTGPGRRSGGPRGSASLPPDPTRSRSRAVYGPSSTSTMSGGGTPTRRC